MGSYYLICCMYNVKSSAGKARFCSPPIQPRNPSTQQQTTRWSAAHPETCHTTSCPPPPSAMLQRRSQPQKTTSLPVAAAPLQCQPRQDAPAAPSPRGPLSPPLPKRFASRKKCSGRASKKTSVRPGPLRAVSCLGGQSSGNLIPSGVEPGTGKHKATGHDRF